MADRPTTRLPCRCAPVGVVLALLLVACGCSPWLRQATNENVLPAPHLSPDTVIVEVAFVHLTPDDHAAESSIWRQLDEQPLPIETRQKLAGNGIRAGLAASQLPEELRRLVERTTKELSQAPSGDDVTTAEFTTLARQRRMQVRTGRRGKIMVSGALPRISVLAKDEQGRVQGDAYSDAQCLFSLLASPQGDGRTQIQLTPEIEHGDLKNRWIPLEGALVQQVGKDRKVYEHLKIELPLVAGQVLLIGPTEAPSGVGQHFFTLKEPQPRRTMLLIRIAQTQQDELFQKPERSDALFSIAE